jgi:hypothetical protein
MWRLLHPISSSLLIMLASAHVCNRRVSPVMPSSPRLILQYLQRMQGQWHGTYAPDLLQPRKEDGIICVCFERLGQLMGDMQASQLAQALSLLPNIACLQVLQLCRNSLGPVGLQSLLSCLKSPLHLQLQCLALCHNPIGNCNFKNAI